MIDKLVYSITLHHEKWQRIGLGNEHAIWRSNASVSNFIKIVSPRLDRMGKKFIAEDFIETLHIHHFVRTI